MHEPQAKINDPVMVKVKVNEIVQFVDHFVGLRIYDLRLGGLRQSQRSYPRCAGRERIHAELMMN